MEYGRLVYRDCWDLGLGLFEWSGVCLVTFVNSKCPIPPRHYPSFLQADL